MVRHARMNGRPTLWLPGLDHASIAAQVVLDRILDREGETRAVARTGALPRADVGVRQRRPARRSCARAGASARRSIGSACGSRWTRRAHGPCARRSRGCTTTASPTGPRPWPTGASAARRRSATSRSCRRRRRARSGRSATTSSTTPAVVQPGPLDRDRHDPPRDAPGRCRGRRPSRTTRATRPGRRDRPDPVRRAARAGHRRRRRPAGVRDRCRQDHPGPRPGRLRDGPAPRPADDQRLRRRRPDQRERRRLSPG